MSRERCVEMRSTTSLPTRTYHITNHKFIPIRYEPGVEVIRKPNVEHKVITSGNILTGEASNHGYNSARTGPRRKETIEIHRSRVPTYEEVGGFPTRERDRKKVVKVVGGNVIDHGVVSGGGGSLGGGLGGGLGGYSRTSTVSNTVRQPENFMNMQRSMENELDRRRTDWEGEVEKMQHSFFDMKTSDASKDKLKDSDLRPRGGEILTVGDSHNLFHELADGSKVYRQKFDLYGFDTDDLSVRAENGKLTISASREEDYEGATSMRKFNRTVDIPEAVDQDQISSFIADDGILTIEAPVIIKKLDQEDSSVSQIRRSHAQVTEQPGFSARTRLDNNFPPEFDTVVETTTKTSGGGISNSSMSPSSASAFSSRSRNLGPDVEETPHGRKLKTSLYLGKKYKPDDVTVKLYDYTVNVVAQSEEVIGGRTSRRQFSRDVSIPGPVERGTFRAVLGTDGRLYLGGSFAGNENHDGVSQAVDVDMPSDGKDVNIIY